MSALDAGQNDVLSVRQRIVIALCVALVATGLWGAPVAAHDAAAFYSAKWGAGGADKVFYLDDGSEGHEGETTPGFPHLESWRFRMDNAADRWNNSDSDADKPIFRRATGDGTYRLLGRYWQPCGLDRNGLFHANLNWFSTSTLAMTSRCQNTPTSPPIVTRFTIAFDSSGRDWYSGTGTPSSTQYDLYGVATHEFGHATGWSGHFGVGSAQCGDPDTYHTMCPELGSGQTRWRTLAEHDIHTWHAAY